MAVTELDMRAVEIAKAEWWFFGSQYVDGESSALPMYSAPGAHGSSSDENQEGWKQRTWTYMKYGVYPESDGWMSMKAEPWSAAFISYCMRMAGARNRFPYNMSHSAYVARAFANRNSGNVQDNIVAYATDEVAPSIGDLLWRGRKSNDPKEVDTTGWGYKDIQSFLKSGKDGFPSHCDIVISTNLTTRKIHMLGGNVRNRVLRTQVNCDSNGFVGAAAHTVVIKNNISD